MPKRKTRTFTVETLKKHALALSADDFGSLVKQLNAESATRRRAAAKAATLARINNALDRVESFGIGAAVVFDGTTSGGRIAKRSGVRYLRQVHRGRKHRGVWLSDKPDTPSKSWQWFAAHDCESLVEQPADADAAAELEQKNQRCDRMTKEIGRFFAA